MKTLRSISVLLVICIIFSNPFIYGSAEGTDGPGEPVETVHAVEQVEALTDLSMDSEGEQVETLQRRLNQLGFFTAAIDGVFGSNTRAAVREAKEYIRLIEQRDIDARIAAETSAVPATSAPAADGTEPAQPTPAPTSTPGPAPTPSTTVNGIADLTFQELIYGDVDRFYLADVSQGSSGPAALRVQRRLVALNYLNDAADGLFGVNSVTALTAFQSDNGLAPTGIADRSTQAALFNEYAEAARKPVYNQLMVGMSGDIVKAIQQQLIYLGFMNGSASGVYDTATRNGVMALEKYLYLLDNNLYMRQSVQAVASPDEFTPLVSQSEPVSDAAATAELGNIEGDPEVNPYEVLPDAESKSQADAHGFEATGVMTDALIRRVLEDGIQVYEDIIREGDRGDSVLRVQRRLASLEYITASGLDGIYGSGTKSAISAFQRRNHIEVTGICDQATQFILFTPDAIRSIKPYMIKVSVADQRVYVYSPDENDNYTNLVHTFVCSTGTSSHPTPKGTFKNTGRGAQWHYFTKFKCWARYAWYVDGDIMIHSVIYSRQDESSLNQGSVNALGSRASHGCIRLAVDDARWIWNNCGSGTTVVVY